MLALGPLLSLLATGEAGGFSMDQLAPAEIEFPFAARVVVHLDDGAVFEDEELIPCGSSCGRVSALQEIAGEKFRAQAENLYGAPRAVQAEEAIKALSWKDSIQSLIPVISGSGSLPAPGLSQGDECRK